MSILQRLGYIVKAEVNHHFGQKPRYYHTYKPFSCNSTITIHVDDWYLDMFVEVLNSQFNLQIGVIGYNAQLMGIRDQFGFGVIDYTLNSDLIDNVETAPFELYQFNHMTELEVRNLNQFVDSHVQSRGIGESEAEGELYSIVIIRSMIELMDFVCTSILDCTKEHLDNGGALEDFGLPQPYDVDFDDESIGTKNPNSLQSSINLNGFGDYAKNLCIPIYPYFAPSMRPARDAVVQYFEGQGQEVWADYFAEIFELTQNDYLAKQATGDKRWIVN
jgi:hypothetical protein